MRVDSSWNPVYQRAGSFANEKLPVNRAFLFNGVLEAPVTVTRQPLPIPGKVNGLVPLEICALSSAEMRMALEQLHANGVRDAVIAHHSFACVKVRDLQYSQMKPDRVVMRRFRALLDYLADHSDRFETVTMGDVAEAQPPAAESPDFIPVLGYIPPLLRTMEQAVNRLYVV